MHNKHGYREITKKLYEKHDMHVQSLVHMLALRDIETEEHTRRVTALVLELARAYGLSKRKLVHIRRGALLHDLGKIGIPDRILLKPGELTFDERKVMHMHPIYAYELLSPFSYLRPALDIPSYHHEKWDGTGYPCGLKGMQIPLAARLFAVVDVWDALLTDRPYRSAWSEAQALAYLHEQSGQHFDPYIVDVFLKNYYLILPKEVQADIQKCRIIFKPILTYDEKYSKSEA